MLAAKTVELSREQTPDLITEVCARVGRDPLEVIRAFRRGQAGDLQHLSEAYAFELLPDDDPSFAV